MKSGSTLKIRGEAHTRTGKVTKTGRHADPKPACPQCHDIAIPILIESRTVQRRRERRAASTLVSMYSPVQVPSEWPTVPRPFSTASQPSTMARRSEKRRGSLPCDVVHLRTFHPPPKPAAAAWRAPCVCAALSLPPLGARLRPRARLCRCCRRSARAVALARRHAPLMLPLLMVAKGLKLSEGSLLP